MTQLLAPALISQIDALCAAIVAAFGNERSQLGGRLAISDAISEEKKARLRLGVKLGVIRREIRRD